MKIIFSTGLTIEQPRQDKNLLYRHEEASEATKEGPLSYVLQAVFLGLSDPDPLVRCMDPDPDPSIIKQK
jgi:hypothetical protein